LFYRLHKKGLLVSVVEVKVAVVVDGASSIVEIKSNEKWH